MFIPLGQTMEHLPQSMQFDIRGLTSCPRRSERITLRTLIPLNSDAGQVALQEPQAIQILASGSIEQSLSNKEESTSSKFRMELFESLKPKSVIAI